MVSAGGGACGLGHKLGCGFLEHGLRVGLRAVTVLLVRPVLARAKGWMVKDEELTDAGLVAGIALMTAGAWFTDLVGLHAVFGAFVMGARYGAK